MYGKLIRGLQERAARAQPTAHVEEADGWLLRHATGGSWWIGSVVPHRGGGLASRVEHAESFYAAHGAVPRFQVTPGACPPGLDSLLAARGYRSHSPVCLMVGDATRVPLPPKGIRIELGGTAARVEALAFLEGEKAGWGRAVTDGGWTGIFGMATLPAARGRGVGRAVLAALAGQADRTRRDGPVPLYLQVERDNPAAQRLYRWAGFGRLCEYRYRSRD